MEECARWSAEKAARWYKEKPWILGFNYVTSTAVNSTEMWQSETFDAPVIEREMALACGTGYNSCRVFLQYLVWKNEGDRFLANFSKFLEICGKNNISVMPIFFDDCAFSGREPYCGKQDDPVPGIHNSGWTASPGFTAADDPNAQNDLKAYVQTITDRFKNDRRIIAWDLYNEPGNSGRNEKCLPLLRNVFVWARECNPIQPLTAGLWAFNEDFNNIIPEVCDIISFHDYTGIIKTQERIAMLKKFGRPVLCTEWLHRFNVNTFESHLPVYKSAGLGVYQWGLVNGKTQTHLNWDKSKNTEAMPKIWQHDIFTKDLQPYSPDEISLIKKLSPGK
ncbi:MAG: glycoside hydrolase family 5 protein [Treponema sp.]|nr:glycoside hydrolase family 5 protein [Treponema sp.]